MFGHKSLIASYEARIADLKSQIEDLKSLVFPKNSFIPLTHIEADAVMSGKDEQIEISDAEMKLREDEMSEADRLLAGTY